MKVIVMSSQLILDTFRNRFDPNIANVEEAIEGCSSDDLYEWIFEITRLMENYEPGVLEVSGSSLVGNSSSYFSRQGYWADDSYLMHFNARFDNSIRRLLLYSESVAVFLEKIDWYNLTFKCRGDDSEKIAVAKHTLKRVFSELMQYAPLIEKGYLQLIPEPYFNSQIGIPQNPGAGARSEVANLTDEEKEVQRIKDALDGAGHFSDEFEDKAPMSDSFYYWHKNNDYDHISYWSPLYHLNQDVIFQALNRMNLVCSHKSQFRTLLEKGRNDRVSTNETVWRSMSLSLPELANISVSDLIAIRESESLFQDWRTSITSISNEWRRAGAIGEALSEADITASFDHAMMPLRNKIESEVSKSRFRNLFEPSMVSFAAGAIASTAVRPDPSVALAVGGVSSTLKLLYDVVRTAGRQIGHPNRVFLRYLPKSRE